MDNWLTIAVGVYLIGMILYGFFKGFIKLAVSMVALVISLIVVNFVSPHISNFIKQDTPIYASIQKGMQKAIGLDELEAAIMPADQRIAIEKLVLPKQLKEALLENNNSEVYNQLGIGGFAEYVSCYLADIVVNIMGFLFTFVVVYSLLQFVVFILDIVAKLPIINGINKIAGAALGGLQGFIFLWILCLVVTAFAGTGLGRAIVSQIESSTFLSVIYDNNLLTTLVLGIIRTVI